MLGAGAGAPSLRLSPADVAAAWGLSAGKGRLAVCADDEDALTLAWQAASRAIEAAGLESGDIEGLWWGTTRPPLAEGPSYAFLAAALGLRRNLSGALLAGSPHAGMEALLAAWDAVAAGSIDVAVIVVSDALVPGLGTSLETRTGAGAAALVMSRAGGTAALTGRVTRTRPVLDRYRGDGEPTTRDLYDPRLFREEVFVPAVTEAGTAIAAGTDVRAWSLPDPDGRMAGAVAKRLSGDNTSSASVYADFGDTGAAAPLLGLLGALDRPGTVAAVGYGGGRTTAVTIAVEAPVPGAGPDAVAAALTGGQPVDYARVLRSRRELVASGDPVPMGVPPGSAGFVRGNVEMLGLLGAQCVDCGTINTPPSIHPTCISCGGAKLEEVALARHGTVHTFVVNQTMPAPFVAPLPLVVVDLDDGARVMLQGTSADASSFAIGDRVGLMLRRYTLERGVPVYGYKVQRET